MTEDTEAEVGQVQLSDSEQAELTAGLEADFGTEWAADPQAQMVEQYRRVAIAISHEGLRDLTDTALATLLHGAKRTPMLEQALRGGTDDREAQQNLAALLLGLLAEDHGLRDQLIEGVNQSGLAPYPSALLKAGLASNLDPFVAVPLLLAGIEGVLRTAGKLNAKAARALIEDLPFDAAEKAFLGDWLYGRTGNEFRHGRPDMTLEQAQDHSALALLGVALALDIFAANREHLDWIVERVSDTLPP